VAKLSKPSPWRLLETKESGATYKANQAILSLSNKSRRKRN